METKLISIVVPAYNEERNILPLYQEIKKALDPLDYLYEFEIIFVDDGSGDSTDVEIEKLAQSDARVKLIAFSRNFGKEVAVTAGIRHALGAAAVIIDADLQHPAALIPEFLSRWEKGAEVVVGVRRKNKNYTLAKKFGSILYYKLMKAISKSDVIPRETDFRLIDRAVIDAFNSFTEHQRNTRALINWLGFKREYIEFDMDKRASGRASYSLGKLFHLAIYSFVSHSLFPLRIAGYLGGLITFFSALLGVAVFFERYVFHDVWNWHISGAAQLSIINAFLIGVVLMCLGIVALYIENIQNETTNRPMYVIRKKKL